MPSPGAPIIATLDKELTPPPNPSICLPERHKLCSDQSSKVKVVCNADLQDLAFPEQSL